MVGEKGFSAACASPQKKKCHCRQFIFDESSFQLSCGLKTRSLYAMSVVGIRSYPARVNGRTAVNLISVADSLIRGLLVIYA